MYAPADEGAITPYFSYDNFHAAGACEVFLLTGITNIVVYCSTCKVVAPVETVGYRIGHDEALSPAPEEDLDGDTGHPGPSGD